jgi:E3 ubiquitin-protein ligase HERC2
VYRKLLVHDTPTIDDFEGIDYSLVKSLEQMRELDKESFNVSFYETFTTISSNDKIVELMPNGSNIDVTYANREEYCDLVLKYHLHQFDQQADAVRHGLATIVPISMLSLFTWERVEMMVCGVAEVDVRLLESVTDYSSCSPADAHIQFFWQALRDFNNEERSALIRFVWGRSRLPLDASGFSQRFKIQGFSRQPADVYLPVSHTCFFSLELPQYSSLDIMKEKLRYAIFNCQAIDGDDTAAGIAAAAMGWEE